MTVDYTYSLSADFPHGLNPSHLHGIIMMNTLITVLCTRVDMVDDSVVITFLAALDPAEEEVLDSIVAEYAPPDPGPAIVFMHGAGKSAYHMKNVRWNGGITFKSADNGTRFNGTSSVVFEHLHTVDRPEKGSFKRRSESQLSDADHTLTMTDVWRGILTIQPETVARTLTLPSASVLLSDLVEPSVDDSFDLLVFNVGLVDVHIAMGEGGTGIGDMIVESGTSTRLIIRISRLEDEAEVSSSYQGPMYSAYGVGPPPSLPPACTCESSASA